MVEILEVQHRLRRWYCLCTTSDTASTVLAFLLFCFCWLWVFVCFYFGFFVGFVWFGFCCSCGVFWVFCLFWGFSGGCFFLVFYCFFLKLITQLLLKTRFGRGLEITSGSKAERASKREKELLVSRFSTMLGA